MPANRKYGLDHPHHKWSTLPERKALRWPNKSRLALCVVVNLEHMDWKTPSGAYEAPNMAGGLTPRPWPDYARYGHRDYGHRIGIFRVLDALEERGIKATVAMDAMTAQHYPFLVEHCLQRGCEIIAHGVAASRMITSKMTAAQERAYIKESIDAIAEATGKKPQGWFSPEYGESTRTPQLLAEAGIRYVCDWPNDEQPYIEGRDVQPAADAGARRPPGAVVSEDTGVAVQPDAEGSLRKDVRGWGRKRPAAGAEPAPVGYRTAVSNRLSGGGAGAHDGAGRGVVGDGWGGGGGV